jgi:hypothetical protein
MPSERKRVWSNDKNIICFCHGLNYIHHTMYSPMCCIHWVWIADISLIQDRHIGQQLRTSSSIFREWGIVFSSMWARSHCKWLHICQLSDRSRWLKITATLYISPQWRDRSLKKFQIRYNDWFHQRGRIYSH